MTCGLKTAHLMNTNSGSSSTELCISCHEVGEDSIVRVSVNDIFNDALCCA